MEAFVLMLLFTAFLSFKCLSFNSSFFYLFILYDGSIKAGENEGEKLVWLTATLVFDHIM